MSIHSFSCICITVLSSSVLKVYLLKIIGAFPLGVQYSFLKLYVLFFLKQVLCFQDIFQNILSCGILWSFSWNGISTSSTNFGWAKTSQNGSRSLELKCRKYMKINIGCIYMYLIMININHFQKLNLIEIKDS